jgi:hypothetical protein
MKKLSLVSKEQTVNGFMNVKIDRQYAAVDDRSSSMSLGDPRLLKSYSYGDVLVPVGKMLEKSSFYTAKTLVIIGFARRSERRKMQQQASHHDHRHRRPRMQPKLSAEKREMQGQEQEQGQEQGKTDSRYEGLAVEQGG